MSKELWRATPQWLQENSPALIEMMADLNVTEYSQLHAWSLANPGDYWSRLWSDVGVVGEQGGQSVSTGSFLETKFFPAAQLNVVDTLLAQTGPGPAIVAISEDGSREVLSWDELRVQVAAVAAALRTSGVDSQSRVAAWTPNIAQTMVFALGALAIGAQVSTASPDFGPQALIDRFGQVEPTVLLAVSEYRYAGKSHNVSEKLVEIVQGLPTLNQVVIAGSETPDLNVACTTWDEWLSPHVGIELVTTPLEFAHPGFILFSSGTTGKPKCIVHSAAGIMLKVMSEQVHHMGVQPGDRVLYVTTCGWMLWNWLLFTLARKATVVLYDGNVMYPDISRIYQLAHDETLNFLGLSAKFIDSTLKSGFSPRSLGGYPHLRTIASTGSPLSPAGFDFVYSDIKQDVHLSSMSGGTDICGCFVLGVPTLAVIEGEIQAPALGMDVTVFDDDGNEAPVGLKGELVCRNSFPSVPLGFLGPDGDQKFHSAYFDRFPDTWAHGDFIERRPSGGLVIHGRSDATLNSQGVRIGTAEIYGVVEELPQVAESLAVARKVDGDTEIVLFVVLAGSMDLNGEICESIRLALRTKASPRHVPKHIVQAPTLPRTKTGKLAELAVTDVINGEIVRNTTALENPESIEWFKNWAQNL